LHNGDAGVQSSGELRTGCARFFKARALSIKYVRHFLILMFESSSEKITQINSPYQIVLIDNETPDL
jgi:hypothetical protein